MPGDKDPYLVVGEPSAASAPMSPVGGRTPAIRRRSSSMGVLQVKRGSVVKGGGVKPCQLSSVVSKRALAGYARDPFVRSPDDTAREEAGEGGRYTGNHTSKGREVLKDFFQKSQNFLTRAEEIYARVRHDQLGQVAGELFNDLQQFLQAQVRYYTENPDLVDRFIFDEHNRGEVYKTILQQFCGYELDFDDLLLEEILESSLDEGRQLQLRGMLPQVSNKAFISLQKFKDSIVRRLGDLSVIPASHFFEQFNQTLIQEKESFLASAFLKDRWIKTWFEIDESFEWEDGCFSVAEDLKIINKMGEKQIKSYDLLRLISLFNAAGDDFLSDKNYSRSLRELRIRLQLLTGSTEISDELLCQLGMIGSAKSFPFAILKKRIETAIRNQKKLLPQIDDEKWQQLEIKISETVLPQAILERFSHWQLVCYFYKVHEVHEVCKVCKAYDLLDELPLEGRRIYQALKKKMERKAVLPPYYDEEYASVEDLKTWLVCANEYAHQLGEPAIFADSLIADVELAKIPVEAESGLRKCEVAFTIEALQDLTARVGEPESVRVVTPLLHWIITYREALADPSNAEITSQLFTDATLFPELMPSLLGYGDLNLLNMLLRNHLTSADSAERFSQLLMLICEEYAVTCRLDNGRLEKIAYSTVLKMMAGCQQEGIRLHLAHINRLFTHDIRAVFAYVDGMSEADFQSLMQNLSGINFMFDVNPKNHAIRPYLLLRSAPHHQRASDFAAALIETKQTAASVLESLKWHAEEDCRYYSQSKRQGKKLWQVLDAIGGRAPVPSVSRCETTLFQPAIEKKSELEKRVQELVKNCRSRLTESCNTEEGNRLNARLKLLSGLSRLLIQTVPGDDYGIQAEGISVAVSELKKILAVGTLLSKRLAVYDIGHKKLTPEEVLGALRNPKCRQVVRDYLKLAQEQLESKSTNSSSACR